MKPKYQIGKIVFFFKQHHVAKDWLACGKVEQITLDGRSKTVSYYLEGDPGRYDESSLYSGPKAIITKKVKELKEDIALFQEVLETLEDALDKERKAKDV